MIHHRQYDIENRGSLGDPLEGEPAFPRSPSNSPFVPSFPSSWRKVAP